MAVYDEGVVDFLSELFGNTVGVLRIDVLGRAAPPKGQGTPSADTGERRGVEEKDIIMRLLEEEEAEYEWTLYRTPLPGRNLEAGAGTTVSKFKIISVGKGRSHRWRTSICTEKEKLTRKEDAAKSQGPPGGR